MSGQWPNVALGELLRPVSRPEPVLADSTYRILGAHWYAEGLYVKNTTAGSAIQADRLYRVEEGDFIYNRLFAWKGSFALALQEHEGTYVSNEFPCFAVNSNRLDPRFLSWYFRRSPVWNEALTLSTGGTPTSRNRLKEDKFLGFKIPLPPLDEQRSIVARIEALAAKIEEARGLRLQAATEADGILAGEELKIWPECQLKHAKTLEEVTTFLARGRHSLQGPSDHFLIKTQHVQLGHYIPSRATLAAVVAERVHPEAMVRPGDVLIACSAAGCLGRVAFYGVDGAKASTDTHVAIARARSDQMLPEYLYAYLKGAQGQRQLRSREKGDWQREKVGFRLTELNVADMRRVPVPLPPLSEQRRIVAHLDDLQAKADALKRLQAETAAELDALLPSILDKAFKGEL